MDIQRLILKKSSLGALAIGLAFICTGCSDGGSNSVASTASTTTSDKPLGLVSPSEAVNAFTVVVGPPYVSSGSTPMYDDLYKNLTSPSQQAKVPISRILLAIENPGVAGAIRNGVFRIGDSFTLNDASNGQVITFLNNLATYNAKTGSPIEIYAYPDVEKDSLWETWVPPINAPRNIPSCNASLTQTDPPKKAMLNSICWTTLVNQLINSDKLTIAGVAYDNQSNYLAGAYPSMSATGWTYPYAHGDATARVPGLNLGWISGGGIANNTADKVDLNLIEVYDLYSNKGPYYDTVAYSDIYKILPSGSPYSCSTSSCAYAIGNGSLPFFPGYQYQDPTRTVGAVGSNIYQCAISKGSTELNANGCNGSYTDNIDVNATPDLQLLESLNYIKFNLSPLKTPQTSDLGVIYQNANGLAGTVVYLLSTQYAGPVGSYYIKDKTTGNITSSQSLCIDSTNKTKLCSCIASKYNTYASCGDENGFGSWGAHLSDFKNFVFGAGGFMSSQGGKNCPGSSCSPGLYMYDFIPQAWYQ